MGDGEDLVVGATEVQFGGSPRRLFLPVHAQQSPVLQFHPLEQRGLPG